MGDRLFADASGDLTLADTGLFIGTVLIVDPTFGAIYVSISAQGAPGAPGPAATVGVVLVTPLSATTQVDITTALASAVSGDVVAVGPGIYPESFTVPDGVSVIGVYDAGVTFITGQFATGTRVFLGSGSIIQGVNVTLPTDNVPAINCTGAIPPTVEECSTTGAGGSGIAIAVNGGGATLNEYSHNGDCEAVIECNSGITFLVTSSINSGTITDLIRINNGTAFLCANIVVSPFVVATDGLVVAAAVVETSSVNIEGCVNALHITSDLANIKLRATRLEGLTNDILVDPALSGGTFRANSSEFSTSKINAPLPWLQGADIGIAIFDSVADDDTTFRVATELAVGTPNIPSRAAFGEGDAYNAIMTVLTNTNTTIGTWANITTAMKSVSGSTAQIFPGVGSNNCCFFGSIVPFYGLEINIVTAEVIGAGSLAWEYWNGATWVQFSVMTSLAASPLTQFSNTVFQRTGIETISFQQGFVGWTPTALNGFNLYWVRARIVTPITTPPVLEYTKLIPNQMKIGQKGEVTFFGDARVGQNLPWNMGNLFTIVGAAPSSESILVSTDISLAYIDNEFTNNSVDSRGGIIRIPLGLDTSSPLSLSFDWFPLGTGGDVELEVNYAYIKPGNTLNGTLTQFSLANVQTAPLTNVTARTTFQVPVNTVVPGDMIAIRVFRDARGSNPQDTLAASIALFNTQLTGLFWKL